ncbi:MAG: hypothetical protein AB1Z23_03460 [Eubacteriales bacterium]
MSYQKIAIEDLFSNLSSIKKSTLDESNLTDLLEYYDLFFEIRNFVNSKDESVGKLWNEIIIELTNVITSLIFGFYRSSLVVLRGVLELSCSSFFYYDHKIEYFIFENHDKSADTYVSALTKNYSFYKTEYIESFYKNIQNEETETNSVSAKLNEIYSKLCDNVHGRYSHLSKIDDFSLKYIPKDCNSSINFITNTLSIISVLFVLRFNYKSSPSILKLANKSKVVNFSE